MWRLKWPILHCERTPLNQGKIVFTASGEHLWRQTHTYKQEDLSLSLPRQEAKETPEPSDKEGRLQTEEEDSAPHGSPSCCTKFRSSDYRDFEGKNRDARISHLVKLLLDLKRRRKLPDHPHTERLFSEVHHPPKNKTPKDEESASKSQSFCNSQVKKKKFWVALVSHDGYKQGVLVQ